MATSSVRRMSAIPPRAPVVTVRRDGRERLLTAPFAGVWAANLLQGMSFFLFIHLPRFLVDLGAGEVTIGSIVAVTAVVAIVARPPIGSALDRRGRRTVVVAGALLNVVATGAYLTISTLGPWLVVVRVVHGVAEATLFTAIFTIGADLVPASRRTEGLALFGVSGLLPVALGGLLGDVILSRGGIDDVFVTSCLFAVAALALVSVLPMADGERDVAAPGGFVRVLRAPDLRPVWLFTTAFSLALAAYFVFIAVYVDVSGAGSVGAFFGAYVATAVGLRFAFAWVPERVGERRVLLPSACALAVGLVVLASFPTTIGVVVAGVLCGASHGYVFPILFSQTVTRAGEADRGSAMALFSALFDVGTLIGGPVLGLVVARAGYATMFMVAAAVVLAATVVHAVWDRPTVHGVAPVGE